LPKVKSLRVFHEKFRRQGTDERQVGANDMDEPPNSKPPENWKKRAIEKEN